MNNSVILPGAAIGIMGGGQLGRMFGFAASKLGYPVDFFAMDDAAPVRNIARNLITSNYTDLNKVREFVAGIEVLSFEFENIPIEAVHIAEKLVAVRPSGHVLHIAQNRIREKTFLSENNFPIAPFMPVSCLAELEAAVHELGLPGVLKTAAYGYDGKGQVKVFSTDQLSNIWRHFEGAQGVYESFIRFEKELSVVAARTLDGEFRPFPVFENSHANHILDVTFAPASISVKVAEEAYRLSARVLDKLDVVGVMAVEFFLTMNGTLLINEIAPRTHNSGHLTIEACVTSQFEQQLRAICGLPLGKADLYAPAAMANLLGDLWTNGEPDWAGAAKLPGVHIHNYQKVSPRKGRKMGHLTALGKTTEDAVQSVLSARELLSRN